jgi:hypothetical protein
MTIAFATIAAVALGFAGFSALALAMNRHHQQVLKRAPSTAHARGLRATGWILLSLSLVCCVMGWGASVGPVVWFGLLSADAIAVVLLLTYLAQA